MDWWEDWLGGIVGQENVFIVTWLLAVVGSLTLILVLMAPKGRP